MAGSIAAVRCRVHALIVIGALALVGTPCSARLSRNMELVGSTPMPPLPAVPPDTLPGTASDLAEAAGFVYVGRFHEAPNRVQVFDATNPLAPFLHCEVMAQPGSHVEDVEIEGQWLYIAQEDGNADVDGIQVHDLQVLTGPSCAAPPTLTFAPGVPGAHNLFFYDHSAGARVLVATDTDSRAVHVLDVTDPAAPVYVDGWFHGMLTTPTHCPLGGPQCGPHDAAAYRVGTRDLILVAALNDGAYILDFTQLGQPGFSLQTSATAHFGYTWTTPDIDGDGNPDECDTLGIGLLQGPLFNNLTHDARLSPDQTTIWTTDERACGGHVKIWDVAEIMMTCSDADFCARDEIAPVGELRLAPDISLNGLTIDPQVVHQVRFDGSFGYLSWYEEGLRVVDLAARSDAPVEIGFYDTVVPNTDGCMENDPSGMDCASGSANRILNRGFFGTWGVAWDDCYFYLSERGSPDNNGGPGTVGQEAEVVILRYTGGPEPPQPLRITKNPVVTGRLDASWGTVPMASTFNVYRGTLDSLISRRAYDHEMITTSQCDVAATSTNIDSQVDGVNYYYLVTARSRCDPAEDREGNSGHDSFGLIRPDASPTCPL